MARWIEVKPHLRTVKGRIIRVKGYMRRAPGATLEEDEEELEAERRRRMEEEWADLEVEEDEEFEITDTAKGWTPRRHAA